jgi:hypothetical protein
MERHIRYIGYQPAFGLIQSKGSVIWASLEKFWIFSVTAPQAFDIP